MDPQDQSFINDYEKFKTKTFELDRKLGAVLGKSFDDCLVTESIFKLLQIFGSLIQRPLISQELNERMPILVTMIDQEMDEANMIYEKQMKRIEEGLAPYVDKNMPQMTGQLKWSQKLRQKMAAPIRKFKELKHPVCFGYENHLVYIELFGFNEIDVVFLGRLQRRQCGNIRR